MSFYTFQKNNKGVDQSPPAAKHWGGLNCSHMVLLAFHTHNQESQGLILSSKIYQCFSYTTGATGSRMHL
jgi:hypothetical protein